MSKRTAQPALYEKMNLRAGPIPGVSGHPGAGQPVARVEPKAVIANGPSTPWLAPGRSVRLPVGYLLLAAAGVLILVFGTYMLGHHQGYKSAATEFNNLLVQASNAQAQATLLDPLKEVPAGAPAASNTPKLGTSPPAVSARHPSEWGPMVSDPRVKGLNYFILAEGTETGAPQLAEFCRTNGLETYVVAGKNGRPTRVIALPGFQAGARSSKEVKDLESRIHSVGEKWKSSRRGNSDLRGAYPSLFGG